MHDLSEHMPPRLAPLVRVLLRLKTIYVCFGCIVMAFTFFFVVVFRYWLETDLFAYEEWLLVITFWLYFMGAAIGTFENSHVHADLLNYVILDPRRRRFRAIVINTIELIVLLALVYWSVLMMMEEMADYPGWQTTIALQIPFIVPRAAIFVGFALMAFYTALRLYVLVQLPAAAFQPAPDEKLV